MSINAAIYHLTHYKYDRPVIARPADHPAAAGAALPHPGDLALAEGHARRALRQPAAGPLRQLAGALRLPRAGARAEDRGRPRRRHDGLQPVRLLRRGERRRLAVRLSRGSPGRSRHLPHARAGRARACRPSSRRSTARPKRTVDFVVDLNAAALAARSATSSAWSRACRRRRRRSSAATGSCRDSSWLLVQILRHLGLAARFVSGYLIQLKPDLVALDGPPGTDHDFTDLHAWCEVYLPGAGWIGLDPTSGPADRREPYPARRDAALPQRRADLRRRELRQGRLRLRHEGDARRRASAHHQAVLRRSLGGARRARRARSTRASPADDVRLTMGGEPTFVSIDDFEAAEWNTDAVGPTKRALADTLIRRLRDRFAPGGFLHYGQGKWYPGETLPRWTFSLYWRRDGKPIWRDPELHRRRKAPDQGAARKQAEALLQRDRRRARRRARHGRRRPTRIRPSGSSRRATCPATSRRRTPSSRIPKSAPASPGCSSAA